MRKSPYIRTFFISALLFSLLPGIAPADFGFRTASARTERDESRVVETPRSVVNLQVFDAVWKHVADEYFDPKFNGVDWGKMKKTYRPEAEAAADEVALYRVLNKMLGELRDTHTFALSPILKRNRDTKTQTGIGLVLQRIDGKAVVTGIRDGSPAQQAGVGRGWILTRVDGVEIDSPNRPALREGQSVRFDFLDEHDTPKSLDLTLAAVSVPVETESRMLENDVLYVRFSRFQPEVEDWFRETVGRHKRARGLILDVRRNPGGRIRTLGECVKALFPKRTTLARFIDRSGEQSELRAPGIGGDAFAGPVVVLIDGQSQSSSEMLAAFMKETKRGVVVGRQSAGKVLNNFEKALPDGGELSLSTRDFQTAKGVRLEGRGVTPDHVVSFTIEDVRRGRDPDLARAVELLALTKAAGS